MQYYVDWVGYPESDRSWEPMSNLQHAKEAVTVFHCDFPGSVFLRRGCGAAPDCDGETEMGPRVSSLSSVLLLMGG